MLGGEPLMDDALMKDFNGGIGCHVSSALEQTLLLPKDMVELRGLKKNEVFLNAKRYLGISGHGMMLTLCCCRFFIFFF